MQNEGEFSRCARKFSIKLIKDKMNHLSNILRKIEKNPGLYIGKKSVNELATLIAGYELALFETTGKFYTFNSKFQDFVQRKQNVEHTSSHWSTLISKNRSDDEAFEIFFAYFYEFEKTYSDN